MYESFFDLAERPFTAAPRADRYFPAHSTDAAVKTLVRCLERGEGAGMLIGPAGSGKSLVCRVLAHQLGDRFDVAALGCGRLSNRRALLQTILYELGLPYRGLDSGELRLALLDHVANTQACPNGVVLLVDEAHALPVRLLDELRMISDVGTGEPRVRLMLAGGRRLEERFADSRLESLQQRLAARCYLAQFDYDETREYVRWCLQSAGAKRTSWFNEDALSNVYRATDGVPRLVNQLCDHALLLAYAAGVRRVDGRSVEEAWADLQQLPAPAQDLQASEQTGPVVEFGSLDDDLDADELAEDAAIAAETAGDESPQWRVMDEFSDADDATPEERIDRVAEQVAALDEDAQPAARFQTEVELTLPGADDPFAETFDSEEIVIAEDAAGGLADWSRLPAVCSGEGRALGSVLSAVAQFTAQPRIALSIDCEDVADDFCDPVYPDELEAFDFGAFTGATSEHVAEGSVATPESDAAVIVVEDDPAPGQIAAGAQAAPVRRQEYRRLFAQLRHG